MQRLLIIALGMLASAADAQLDVPAKAHPPGIIGSAAGTGEFPAIAEARPDAPGYTIYRPQKMPDAALPLVLWGNGGCRDNGLSASHFLREIASHGYVVIANGTPRNERPTVDRLVPAETAPPPALPTRRTPDETQVSQLVDAIGWAERANAAKTDTLSGRVDLTRIAVMGHSCGGLQALAVGANSRIAAVVAFNSGVYNRPGTGLSGVAITKADLKKLHTPVAYVLGGPDDMAYPNGTDDVAQIEHVPAIYMSLPVGHGGTFQLANGGDWARVGVAWLDWQLKRDRSAGAMFAGKDCGLCKAKEWTIVRKHFPETP